MSELPALLPPEPPRSQTLVCANCGAELSGEYCAACGQRHEPHIHTVAHFAGEAFESISHADSRLWRTLWLLFARPGFLTKEFFAGRRAAYLPPFRLYLVLSVLFFLVTGLPSGEPSDLISVSRQARAAATPLAEQRAREQLREAAAAVQAAGGDASELMQAAESEGLVFEVDGITQFCNPFAGPDRGGEGRGTRDNIRRFCSKIQDDQTELGAAVVHNLPRAMFLFLPLLAMMMKALYWRPKRYYVEHLLFLVHNHAFVFFTFSAVGLLALALEPLIGENVGWFYGAAFVYMVWYIFRGMRNFYGQNRFLTFCKYVVLGFSYVITSFVVLLLTLVFTAVSG
jgi:hypothetical protein